MLRTALTLIFSLALLLSPQASFAATPKKPIVFTLTAAQIDISDPLTYPARVLSDVNARILAETDGVVLKILSPLGTKVRRGGALAVIKNIESGYTYSPMTVPASVGGVVSQVKVTVGSQVTRGQELFIVTDPSELKLTMEVSASDVAALRRAGEGEFTVSGLRKPVKIKLLGVSPLIDPATGTATAEFRVITANGTPAPLAPGQLGQARLDVNKRKGFVLPDHAVLYKGDATFARVITDGKAQKVPINLGRKLRGQVEVLSGLKAGDIVIERASGHVAENAEVEVQATDTAETDTAEKVN